MNLKTIWKPAELAIIRKHYPTGAGEACLRLLPGRSLDAVRTRAGLLGVHLNADVAHERRSAGGRMRGIPHREFPHGLDDRPLLEAMLGLDNVTRARLAGRGA